MFIMSLALAVGINAVLYEQLVGEIIPTFLNSMTFQSLVIMTLCEQASSKQV